MALLVMQAVGGFHAYICDCGGQATLTKVDHCHGPHSVECHDHESTVPQQHDEGSGDRQDHEQVIQELQLRSAEAIQAPAVVAILLTWEPEIFEVQEIPEVIRSVSVERDVSPPPGITVARTVVFII